MFMLGWIADYPDPENFLNVLFSSGSGDNHSRYANPDVDRLLQQASAGAGPGDSARALYRQVESIILADAAVIPLYHDVEYWLTQAIRARLLLPGDDRAAAAVHLRDSD